MMKTICGIILAAMSAMLLSACSGAASGSTGKADAIDGRYQSSELRELLEKTRAEGTLLGHQDDFAYGSVWYGEQGRSDVKDVCGDYPAVFGWDISGIERGTGYTDDSVSVASVRKYIAEVAAMGGVSSVRWKACAAVDGESRDAALDSVASFLSGLRDSRGGVVPVIFQPVFDCDGADASMIRPLWRMARSRIANKAKNVLYVYSVSNPDSVADFERQYPGDNYVDIVGLEMLSCADDVTGYKADFNQGVDALCKFAEKHGKIPAVTAAGIKGVKSPDFFTSCIAPVISGRQIGYIMFWRNSWKDEGYCFVPVKGHPAADDFCKFVKSDKVVMCSELSAKNNS